MYKFLNRSRYFIREHHVNSDVAHGGIGLSDIESLLDHNGFQPVDFPCHYDFTFKAKVARLTYLLKTCFGLPSGCLLFFQAPLYSRAHALLVDWLRIIRPSIRILCLVSDIDGLRDNSKPLLDREIRLYKKYRYLIVHNDAMSRWMLSKAPGVSIAMLRFFAFPSNETPPARTKQNLVCFAGHLGKAGFLTQLDRVGTGTHFLIYGDQGLREIPAADNATYKGFYPAHHLPSLIEGSFGLVWDGSAIDGLEGPLGEYLRLNSPHKLSLYIVSALPVICHEDSAIAPLVTGYGIGITIRSLRDIERKIDALSEKEYQQMVSGCKALTRSIVKGEHILNAIDDLTFP